MHHLKVGKRNNINLTAGHPLLMPKYKRPKYFNAALAVQGIVAGQCCAACCWVYIAQQICAAGNMGAVQLAVKNSAQNRQTWVRHQALVAALTPAGLGLYRVMQALAHAGRLALMPKPIPAHRKIQQLALQFYFGNIPKYTT